jgi:hypothetical protein
MMAEKTQLGELAEDTRRSDFVALRSPRRAGAGLGVRSLADSPRILGASTSSLFVLQWGMSQGEWGMAVPAT